MLASRESGFGCFEALVRPKKDKQTKTVQWALTQGIGAKRPPLPRWRAAPRGPEAAQHNGRHLTEPGGAAAGRRRRRRGTADPASAPAGSTWAPRGGEAGRCVLAPRSAPGKRRPPARPTWGRPGLHPPAAPGVAPAATTARGAPEAAGRAPGGGPPLTEPSGNPPGRRAGAGEPASPASPSSLILPAPPSPLSHPTAGSAASVFQIFLEPVAPGAAVARALTEAAEAEARRSLGRGGAARAPPRRPSAQAQSAVTAGWRRRNRRETPATEAAARWLVPLRGCPRLCPRFKA